MWMKVLFVVAIAVHAGCATLFGRGDDAIPVTSNVAGAQVYVDEMLVGQTPTTVTLKRGHGAGTIKIVAPGYAPVVIQKNKKIQGWFWINVVLLNPVGVVVDLVTGHVKRYDTSAVAANLVPSASAPAVPTPALFGRPVP